MVGKKYEAGGIAKDGAKMVAAVANADVRSLRARCECSAGPLRARARIPPSCMLMHASGWASELLRFFLPLPLSPSLSPQRRCPS